MLLMRRMRRIDVRSRTVVLVAHLGSGRKVVRPFLFNLVVTLIMTIEER